MGIIFLAPNTKFWCSDRNFTQCSKECPSHEFDTTEFKTSIISEWDLVCENSYANMIQVLIMAGNFTGSMFFGYISDKFGRKNPLFFIIILEVASGVGAAFSPWLWLFLVLKFLSTMAVGGVNVTGFVLVMEMIGKSYRTNIGIIIQMPYCLGLASLGLLGYLIREWRWFQFAISIPKIIMVLYFYIIPESARWLLTVGRSEESIKIMEKAAKCNRLSTSNIKEKVEVHLEEVKNEKRERGNFMDLIRTYEMRVITICSSLILFFLFTIFFGANQYMGQYADNEFIYLALSGILEFTGSLGCIYVMNRFGRKWILVVLSLLAGVCVLLIIAVSNNSWSVTVLGAMGLMFVGSSLKIMAIFLGELYPTVIRSLGFGVSMTFGYLGSTVSSLIVEFSTVGLWLPPLIFGLSAVLVCVCCLWLPETLNQKLPDTIEEALEIRRGNNKVTKSNYL